MGVERSPCGSGRVASGATVLEYEGARDTKYRSQTSFEYQDFEYGGDCTMTAVIETKATQVSTTSVSLLVRCRGDGFQ